MSKDKRFYSWDEDTKAVALLDILAFSEVTKRAVEASESLSAMTTFTFFENCVLPYRKSMLQEFPREVPTTAKNSGYKASFWHREVPLGAVNFVYLSDGVVLYSHSITHLFRELSAIMGAAITLSVPLRGAVTIGDLHHSEWIERPGNAICLYGHALTRAAGMEKSVKGAGMRVWLEDSVVKLASEIDDLKKLILSGNADRPAQLKWWLGAYNAESCTESQELERQFERWFSEKQIRHWFSGPNCDDTKAVVAEGIAELKSLGR